MKLIKKTKQYLHVRMTEEEYELLEKAVAKKEHDDKQEQERDEYAKWFFTNHVEVNWQDEYSSWHTTWYNLETGKAVQDPGFMVTINKIKFRDLREKAKEIWAKGKVR